MIMFKNNPIFLLLPVLAVAACTAPVSVQPPADIIGVDRQIAAAVEQAAKANVAISEVEVATAAPVRAGPAARIPPGVVLPPESIQPVTVDWNGPVENFLEDMARRAGYGFSITGRAPGNRILVTITAHEEPLYGVVRRAGTMVHGYADIGFNPELRQIELRYGG